jgi:hypothetical protein
MMPELDALITDEAQSNHDQHEAIYSMFTSPNSSPLISKREQHRRSDSLTREFASGPFTPRDR